MVSRKRLTPEESRSSALAAARALLFETGPQAVTLKAVSARIGRTHANLLHHFGSAAGLQKELARHLAETVCESIKDAVRATRAGLGSPREVVDLAFDALDREGGTPRERLMRGTPVLQAADDVYTNHVHADDLARATVLAMWRGKPLRPMNICDQANMKMGDYMDSVTIRTN